MRFPFGPKRLAVIGGVFLCAVGTGLLMQSLVPASSDKKTSGIAVASVAPQMRSAQTESKKGGFQLDLKPSGEDGLDTIQIEDAVFTSALPKSPEARDLPSAPVKLVALKDSPVSDLPQEEKSPTFACEISFSATAAERAMALLDLKASCLPNALFTLHHNGMMISGVTDAEGHWKTSFPALSENALFILAFADGEGAAANAQITGLDEFDRYAVQWTGETEVQIHAFANGATYQESGHVWHESSATAQTKALGYLTRFAENDLPQAQNVEIYTVKADLSSNVDVNVEFEVSDASCGRDFEAQAFVMSGTQKLQVRDLMIAMPDCGTAGEFLVLKNLYGDLTIARK